jgi:uncharacterized membrane protein
MKASSFAFPAAVLFAIAGMAWGMIMGISQDHSAMPAHAHLNLLGWVSLFLMGLYYRVHPRLDSDRIAVAQVGLWIAGGIIHPAGMAFALSGHGFGGPMIGVGSVLLVVSMLLFGWWMIRSEISGAPGGAEALEFMGPKI